MNTANGSDRATTANAVSTGTSPRPGKRRWLRGLALLGAAAALGAVFAAYLDPHTVVDLANRVWNCF